MFYSLALRYISINLNRVYNQDIKNDYEICLPFKQYLKCCLKNINSEYLKV